MSKITFPSKDFSRALAVVGKQIARKSALPILSDVLLRYNHERKVFQLMSSNTEAWLTIDVPFIILTEDDGKHPFNAVVLPYATLKEAMATLPSMPCTAIIDDQKITVEHADGHFSLPVQDAMEFPMPPEVVTNAAPMPRQCEPVCMFSIETSWLLKAMADARTCVANDLLRPVMNCECLNVYADKLVVVSTDSHSLYKNQHDTGAGSDFLAYREFPADGSASLLVPSQVLETVVTAFPAAEKVTITADAQRLRFYAEGIDLVCRSVEGKYPNYNSVIPHDNPYAVTVSRDAMRSSLRRLSIFASESANLVVMHRYKEKLVLEADNVDFSTNGSEQLVIQNETALPEKKKFGFKITTLLSLLNIIETDNVVFHLSDPCRAGLLREEDVNSQLMLVVMPMLVNND